MELGTRRALPKLNDRPEGNEFLHVGEESGGQRFPLGGGHVVERLELAANLAFPREIEERRDELLPDVGVEVADVGVEVGVEEELRGFEGLSEGGGGLGVGGERDGDDGVDVAGEVGSEGEVELDEVGEIGEEGLENERGELQRRDGEQR